MKKVGVVGWRGMVGSVLMERFRTEADFKHFEPVFFTTSQEGKPGPDVGKGSAPLVSATSLETLSAMDIIVSCQGGDYTEAVHPKLRDSGWQGYWIDAASTLRMSENAAIVLDPVNRAQIDRAIASGIKDFAGGNCTVSLMLMAINGLYQRDWVEWVNVATYQAASGAGARNMQELVRQMGHLGKIGEDLPIGSSILELDRAISEGLLSDDYPKDEFGAPLGGSLLPWIDRAVEGGRTREEWKGLAETNKLLGLQPPIAVDGICVRVGAMRCHSQALTIKLKQAIPLDQVNATLASANDWVKVIPNSKQETVQALTPAAVTGKLTIAVGRVRTLAMGPEYLSCFTVGDQLLWGAAEPIRRMLLILLGQL